ncbi:hypothetical protein DMENIID0001_053510 [Sergentomyia squamirostris]
MAKTVPVNAPVTKVRQWRERAVFWSTGSGNQHNSSGTVKSIKHVMGIGAQPPIQTRSGQSSMCLTRSTLGHLCNSTKT